MKCFLFVSRSTDYGSTYTKLNDKVGSRTVLSYLYVCPTNKQKVSIYLLLITSSWREIYYFFFLNVVLSLSLTYTYMYMCVCVYKYTSSGPLYFR